MTNYITVKCKVCGHVQRVPVGGASSGAHNSRVAVFERDAPFISTEPNGTLRLITPNIRDLALKPLFKAIAVTVGGSILCTTLAMVHYFSKYANVQRLNDMIDFMIHSIAPGAATAVLFAGTLWRAMRFWTWDMPQEHGEPEEQDAQEPEPDPLIINRASDHTPCWEYSEGHRANRQVLSYFPPDFREQNGRVRHVDIPGLRRFASAIIARRAWIDATRDNSTGLSRSQYNAIRDDWLSKEWIENLAGGKKRIIQWEHIEMIARREPR